MACAGAMKDEQSTIVARAIELVATRSEFWIASLGRKFGKFGENCGNRRRAGQIVTKAEEAPANKSLGAPRWRSLMWSAQARAEGLTLVVAENKTGYFGVNLTYPDYSRPYQARVRRGGKMVSLGSFATAEEAALCVARSPEGQAAAPRPAAAPPLTSGDALPQARDAIVREAALDIIHEAAGAATAELGAEVAAEVMAGIAMGL